jgi:pimeloyl-ACP methyl ester carboxylesterase
MRDSILNTLANVANELPRSKLGNTGTILTFLTFREQRIKDRSRQKRRKMKLPMIMRLFLLITVAALFSGCNIQNDFLYFPDSSRPSEESLKANHLKSWQASATDYRGVVAFKEIAKPKGTVIVFHGNAGKAADRIYYIETLSALGYRVILAEYPAYGGRKGTLGEKAFVADGVETVRLAFEQFGGPVFLLGESLGCGVAAAVAARTPVKIAGIILITPWDTLLSVAQSKFSLLPVQLLLTDKYDSIGNLKMFKGRIALVGAERDGIIPIKHARLLYDSLSVVEKRMWIVKDAGHNDWPMYAQASLWNEITTFMEGK